MEIERLKKIVEEVVLVRPKATITVYDTAKKTKLVSTISTSSPLFAFRQLHGHMSSVMAFLFPRNNDSDGRLTHSNFSGYAVPGGDIL